MKPPNLSRPPGVRVQAPTYDAACPETGGGEPLNISFGKKTGFLL